MERRYWLIGFSMKGFEGKMLVYGTEQEMQAYLNSEIGGADERHTGNYSYSGASDSDVVAARKLGLKCYLAPELD